MTKRTLQRRLPGGIAAVYFGGSINAIVLNPKLTSARRRAARCAILSKPCEVFDVVTLKELAA